MIWQWTVASIVLLATSALSLVVASALLRRHAIAGMSTLACVLVAAAGWSLVAALEAGVISLTSKILFSKLEYVGSGSVVVLFLLFASRYTGRVSWMTKPRLAALWLLPIVSVSLAATNELHQLLWTAFTPGPVGSNTIIYEHGPAFFGIIAGIYAYVLVASLLLVSSVARTSTIRRRQSATLLVATAFPWISGILYAAGITLAPGLNLTPVSFVIVGAVLAIGVSPLHLFDLVPVARDVLIEGMSDGVLVIDADRRIVDVNPAAKQLLALPSQSVGLDAGDVLSDWPRISETLCTECESHLELTVSNDPLLHLDLRISPLSEGTNDAAGFLLDIRDISQRYLAETALQNANQRLQSHVAEIERLQSKLRDQAIRDSLTGVFNRRHLDDTFPRMLDRARGDANPISVVMFDIDHFKQVNDSHGHRAGDALLARLGRLLADSTRPEDIVCRCGGEEFVLIFPQTAGRVAAQRADELRQAFQDLDIPELGGAKSPTLSAGVAEFPHHGDSQQALVQAADEALYRAKAAGRDCVRMAR